MIRRSTLQRGFITLALGVVGTAAGACSTHPSVPLPLAGEPVVVAQTAPPPISGGTLLVLDSGIAVAADSDRDLVWIVNLATRAFGAVALHPQDEPGRVVVDGAGRAHVALRRGGAVVTIDIAKSAVVDRTPVCPAPRGIAYDSGTDQIHVACAGGELVTLPAAGGAAMRTLHLDRDLRDVVVTASGLAVSRFHEAELLMVRADGTVATRSTPPSLIVGGANGTAITQMFTSGVAWRTVPIAGGGFVMTHQRELVTSVFLDAEETVPQPGGGAPPSGGGSYNNNPTPSGSGACNEGIMQSAVTVFSAGGTAAAAPSLALPGAALPVDIAFDETTGNVSVVAAGSNTLVTLDSPSVASVGPLDCGETMQTTTVTLPAQPVAVAYWHGSPVVQTREPAGIYLAANITNPVVLSGATVDDAGHDLFHLASTQGGSLACASCHPEGQEDGHTWTFSTEGDRRTQSLGGNVVLRAPFHWDGDIPDVDAIMNVVFVNRMGGAPQSPLHVQAFTRWLSTIPAMPPSSTASAASIASGKALFESAEVGCSSCHAGPQFTTNEARDVGTGRPFQVPSLVAVSARAPYLHNGCAATLKDRFDPKCGGGDAHGHTSALSDAQVDDIVAYLETL